MRYRLGSRQRGTARGVVLAVALTLVVAACGSSGGTKKGGGGNNTGIAKTTGDIKGAPIDTGTPVPGGTLTMALVAETNAGWCLPEATLAPSGIQVARAIYDYLAVPDAKGGYVPELADKISSNASYTAWTIHIRPGITFHDGTPLNAQVVKDNLDAFRGAFPKRKPQLTFFVFSNFKAVTVVDSMTVRVDMVKPWANFPAILYGYGRFGIMAEKQLNDGKNCFNDMIGTGPFAFKGDWVPNDHITLVRNDHYWRKDKNGVQLPYLQKLVFKPVPEDATMENGLESTPPQFDLALTDSGEVISQIQAGPLKNNSIGLATSAVHPEVAYALFNDSKPPFNNILARQAFAYAVNAEGYNKVANHDLTAVAAGPFGPGTMGYLADTGQITYDPQKAKDLVAQYKAATGQSMDFTYQTVSDPISLRNAQIIAKYLQAVGVKMNIKQVDEATLVSYGIAGTFQASAWRNHPGFDPDTQYVWWHCDRAPADIAGTTHAGTDDASGGTGNNCDNFVNFSHFNDAIINKNLETGRNSTDPAVRQAAYEAVNREFAKQLWEGWAYYALWTVPYSNYVRGIIGPNLPTATSVNAVGAEPFTGLASGIDVAGLWVKK